MKKSIKNNLISLSCALALVALGGGIALNADEAKAVEMPNTTNGLMVVDGAELRLKAGEEDQTGNGLRFVIKAPDATELPEGATETGTLVIPSVILGDAELNVGLVSNEEDGAFKFDTTEAWNVYDDGAYSYAYFWNMPEEVYNVEFTYRGYIVIGGETYYTESATTSLAEVALEASLNGDDEADQYLLNYDVTFNVGASSSVINPQEVKYGSQAATVADPELAGHTFAGWLLDGQPFDFATQVKGDIELTAKWDINSYAVTFADVDGDTTRFAAETVTYNTTVAEPEFIALEPYTNSITWVDVNGDEFDFDTPITAAVTLTAKRALPNKIDFTTMTRLPSELLGSGSGTILFNLDEENHALHTNIWKGDHNNARFYFGDGVQLYAGDYIAVDVQLVSMVDVGHICVNEEAVRWNGPAQWAKVDTWQTLYYFITEDTFVEYIRFKTNHGSSGESINIGRIEIVKAIADEQIEDWSNLNFAELQGITAGVGGGSGAIYDSTMEAACIFGVRNVNEERAVVTFGEPITIDAGKDLVVEYTTIITKGTVSGEGKVVFNGSIEKHNVSFHTTDKDWKTYVYHSTETMEITSIGFQPYAHKDQNTYNFYIKSIKVVDYAAETDGYTNIDFASFNYAPYFVSKSNSAPIGWAGEKLKTSLGYSATEQALVCYNYAIDESENATSKHLKFDYSQSNIILHTGDVISMVIKMEAQGEVGTGGDLFVNNTKTSYVSLTNNDGSSKGYATLSWTVTEAFNNVALSSLGFKTWNVSYYFNVYVKSITINQAD